MKYAPCRKLSTAKATTTATVAVGHKKNPAQAVIKNLSVKTL